MTYAEDIKNRVNLPTKTKKPVKVGVYSRVSTDNDGQKESCANQVEMAERYIAQHPNLELVEVYVDDGISGKNDFNRPAYGQMQSAIFEGKIELIIVKSTSRLNRDVYNAVGLDNFLLEHKATYLTLEDNKIHDLENPDAELMHALNFAMDARYVRNQSINGKKTQQLRIDRKELSAKDISFGYKWDKANKTIVVDSEEAEAVQFIFEAYVYYGKTQAEIQRDLKEMGYDRCAASITKTLKDTRYIGEFPINKRTSQLGRGHTETKRILLPKDQWVIVERPDLAIVDRELFELAQRKKAANLTTPGHFPEGRTQSYYTGHHLFSQKIFCEKCGKPYRHGYADRKQMVPIYRISPHCDCESNINRVYEADLEEITNTAIRETINGQEGICEELEATLMDCLRRAQRPSAKGEMKKLKLRKAAKERERNNLISAIAKGGFDGSAVEAFQTQINNLSAEIETLEQTIRDKEDKQIDETYITQKSCQIHDAISNLKDFTSITRDRVLNYVDKILVGKDGDIEIYLRGDMRILTQ